MPMEIRPVDVPLLRADAVEDVGQYGVRRYMLGLEALDAYEPKSGATFERLARRFAATQFTALSRAVLFYVAPDMLRLSQEAAKTLDAVDLYQEDLPAPEGFIYFSTPLPFTEDGGTVCAASWFMTGDPALVITWFNSDDELRRLAVTDNCDIDHDIRRVNQGLFTAWRLGADQTILIDGERTSLGGSTREGLALATLFSTWHIMRQQLATTTDAHYDRAARRRLNSAKLEPQPVRVIALRRRTNAGSSDETDREYHHQWLVRGHWRQQWYPSQARHRPAWIAPHIKGPEGAPFLGGEKVYALQR